MNNNNKVDTAQKGQTATQDKTPIGKIKTLKNAQERRKEREEQFRNFRVAALRRSCKRMGFSEEDTEKYVEKLLEQMKAPKQYFILVMLDKSEGKLMKEALAKANIKYKYCGDNYFSIDGDQSVLAKIREIAPPSSKIHPYAKKPESVIPHEDYEKVKKPTNNTAEAKRKAKARRKTLNRCISGIHKKGKGKFVAKLRKRKTLLERKKQRKAIKVQMVNKKPSESFKTTKKAA